MKKYISLLALSIILFACSSKKEGNMIVQGQIKGLKKGKLYLQKMVDTVLVSVDSVALKGTNTFKLTDNVDSPVIYYLTFDGNTKNKSILFFGEKGIITINDKVDGFGFNPEIKGSKNQEVLDQYNLVSRKFQNQRLEFIKKDFEAKRANDKNLIEKLEADYKRMVKRRVLYTTNFAISNAFIDFFFRIENIGDCQYPDSAKDCPMRKPIGTAYQKNSCAREGKSAAQAQQSLEHNRRALGCRRHKFWR